MKRKLLPFEHDLIESLGITREEYLEFVALQAQPDFRGKPTADVTAVVLFVVGLILQVVSGLLAPKPKITGQAQTRDERFAPRFGFNSQQELAKYGDPVNLVYANRGTNPGQNPNGGVRVTTSLLWSAVRSYGSSQFVQLLMVIGGGGTVAIDPDKSAFGQTPVRDFITENVWAYFNPSGTGTLRRQDEAKGKEASDPTAYGNLTSNPYRIQQYLTSNKRVDGFSHAYSPTSLNEIGIYGVIPLNINLYMRGEAGDKKVVDLRINAGGIKWTAGNNQAPIKKGETLTVLMGDTKVRAKDGFLVKEAKEVRRSLVSIFNRASIFRLGTATFRVLSISEKEIDEGAVVVKLECTEAGRPPSTPYPFQGSPNLDDKPNSAQFYTKALVQVAIAQYETVSPCHIVDFALRARVFKRISGRQESYGSKNREGYSTGDNGTKMRVSLFRVRYKEAVKTTWSVVPGIFAVRRASESDSFVYFRFNANTDNLNNASTWVFKIEPVSDPIAEAGIHGRYLYLNNNGSASQLSLGKYRLRNGNSISPTIEFTGVLLPAGARGLPPKNTNPDGLNEWDLFSYDADNQIQFSFDSGPEVSVTAVTEQLVQSFSDFDQKNSKGKVIRRLYHGLSLFGFNAYSGKAIQDLRSLTVFVTRGRSVRRLRSSGVDPSGKPWGTAGYEYYPSIPNGPSSLAPDIFLDTVLDAEDGIGKYSAAAALDLRQLALTKRFCIKNKLFMDCVLADPRSWREFWSEVAPYSLLEFARIGGRETLVPAVPYDARTGAISREVNISALFNAGNILEDSYKEEYLDYGSNVQDIIASVVYTDTSELDDEIFAKKRSVDVQLADSSEVDSIRQSFDVSAYISSREHAILFGKLLCNTRRYVRQAIEFKTYPTSDPVSPGAFIYVDIGQNNWDRIRTGMVGQGGSLNTPLDNTPANGTYKFMLYRSGRGMITLDKVTVSNGTASALAGYENYLFVLGAEVTRRRVFRVSEVTMDEEGETTVRGTIYPCTADGRSRIADFSDALFTIRG